MHDAGTIVDTIWFFVGMFQGFIDLPKLKTCYFRLDIWYIGFWIFIAIIIILLCYVFISDGNQSKTACLIVISSIALIFWNCYGSVIVLYARFKTKKCFPTNHFFDSMLTLTLACDGIVLVVICAVIFQYFAVFLQIFKSNSKSEHLMNQIEFGQVTVDELLVNNKDVNDYVLFENEIEKVKEYHLKTFNRKKFEQKFGVGLECSICLYTYFETGAESAQIFEFPGCEHKYHMGCILTWFGKKTTCPLCRKGIRLAFWRELEKKSNTEQILTLETETKKSFKIDLGVCENNEQKEAFVSSEEKMPLISQKN